MIYLIYERPYQSSWYVHSFCYNEQFAIDFCNNNKIEHYEYMYKPVLHNENELINGELNENL